MNNILTEISKETKENYPNISWNKLTGLRDKLTHGYFGINAEKIWETIRERHT
ncbi:MAG: DUF86 domain-containing protein [Elusimicrobiota bacterium]|nr:DUF86 domain-containing protein [Elusimicrobiota bacterium]